MYSVSAYGRMISDAPRIAAYVKALRHTIQPEALVIDLGCGPGLFAILACKFGARRVYAIEPDNVIQIAREAAAANGVSGCIEFIQNFSTSITLPEQADVIVSDLRGVLPFFEHHLPSIVDARERFLARNGFLVPERDFLWASIAETPNFYENLVGPWDDLHEGISLGVGRKFVTNNWFKTRVLEEDLLVEPISWHTLDYYSVTDSNVDTELNLIATRAGTANGLVVWFDSELHTEIVLTNAPGHDEAIYGQAFFPFSKSVELESGDHIHIRLSAHLVNEDYVWRWETHIHNQRQALKAEFKQSTLYGVPLSSSQLRRRATTHIPTLNDDARLVNFVLSRMDGSLSVAQIAIEIARQFPGIFHTPDAALNFVAELSSRYSD